MIYELDRGTRQALATYELPWEGTNVYTYSGLAYLNGWFFVVKYDYATLEYSLVGFLPTG